MKKKKNNSKKRIVIIPEYVDKRVPDEIRPEFEKVINDLANGKIVGRRMELQKCKKMLVCPQCGSEDVSWILDKNCSEVYFNCYNCEECFWQTKKEYEKAIKNNPDCLVENY